PGDPPGEHLLIEATATDNVKHVSAPARYSLTLPRKAEGGQRTTFGGKKLEPEPPAGKKKSEDPGFVARAGIIGTTDAQPKFWRRVRRKPMMPDRVFFQRIGSCAMMRSFFLVMVVGLPAAALAADFGDSILGPGSYGEGAGGVGAGGVAGGDPCDRG